MNAENYVTLEFPSRSANEGFARAAAACFAAQLDPTLEEVNDIKTAVSEAVTNCIVHAYPDSLGRVMLRLRIMKGGRLEIVVKDWGRGIDCRHHCLFDHAPAGIVSGLPLFISLWGPVVNRPSGPICFL